MKNLDPKKVAKELNKGNKKNVEKVVSPTSNVSKKVFSDAVANEGTSEKFGGKELPVYVGKKKNQSIDTILVLRKTDTNRNVLVNEDCHLDPFYQAIHNVVLSYCTIGQKKMTVRMIAATLMGKKTSKVRITQEMYEKILNALIEMSFMQIKIDVSEEAKAYGFEKLIYRSYLLPIDFYEADFGNEKKTDVIELMQEPALLEYAKDRKQLASIDLKVFDFPLNKTQETITLGQVLLQGIQNMDSGKSTISHHILYETIIHKIGIRAENMTADVYYVKKNRIIKMVTKILTYWKEDCDLFLDFRELPYKSGQRQGIEIIFASKENIQKL